ncbi:MAG: TonB-dependent receptor [Acidobacteria bacterium]|nr:TonB-dependent receptor [Acidobacteriota bacterium]
MRYKLLFVCCLLPAIAWAQESRGAIRGRVTDPSGAPAPGVQIQATNVSTGVTLSAATNEQGNYEVPYLLPGTYRVTAELSGFKQSTRDGIQVRVNDRITLDFSLEIGSVTDSVVVTADAPLIDSANASVGAVVDSRRVTELPIAGGNAYHLVRFVAGVRTPGHGPGNPTMDLIGSMAVNGTRTGNSEALVDGVPNMSQGSSTYMVPPQDMVEEFRVQTTTYDASAGRAAGAVVSLTTKSGTNTLHGTAYGLHSPIRAVPWFQSRWLYDPTTGPITEEKRNTANPPWRYQRWGATLSGPVVLPRLYDGRNRTFWSAGYEGLQVSRQQSNTATFPTSAQRQGDFSQLLPAQIQIYDPLSGQLNSAGRTVRQAFPENIMPASRIDPIAARILQYYPEPNTPGDRTGRNNYVRAQDQLWKYRSFATRVDHTFTERWRAFIRYGLSEFDQRTQNFPSEAFGNRNNPSGSRWALDNVFTLSPTMLLNFRYGLVHQKPYSAPLNRGFDLASLGFQQGLVDMIRRQTDYSGVAFPAITVTGHTSLGQAGGSIASNYSHTVGGTLTKIRGKHSVRAGSEYRLYRDNAFAYGNVAPAFTFGNTYTKGPLDTSAGASIGQGLASLLLGIPTAGHVSVNASRAEQSHFLSYFVQDDWRVTPKLTLNAGLRWEYNSPPTERFNRTIRGFAYDTPQPFEARARASYSASPIPEIPAASFAVRGGLTFAGADQEPRQLWNGDWNNLIPRFGLAYQLTPRTVLRSGYGIFYVASGADLDNVTQTGFSLATPIIPTTDNGLTFQATLANPFPSGIQAPPGAATGIATAVGRSISFFNPNRLDGYMQRWSLNIQRELPARTVVEIGYIGNRGAKLDTTQQIAAVPNEYLSTSPTRDQARIDYLNQRVANPFYGLPEFDGTALVARTIARSQLLRPYSHFTGVTFADNDGYSWYHGMTVSVEKRFSHGLLFQTNWTWSKFMEAISYLNPADLHPSETISDLDATHRFALNVIYELPIGRKRNLLGSSPRWLDALVGGWQVQGSYEGQSGAPLALGDIIFNGNLGDIPLPKSERRAERWFNTDAGFERRTAFQLGSNVRTFPLRLSGVRSDGVNNLDASFAKNFHITERVVAQFRLEGINALNHVQFAAPNLNVTSSAFGSITNEYGHGQRQLNFVLKLRF